MSTILDALRKLEEERHSRTADARSRLLLSPPHQAHLQQRQRSPWKVKRGLFSILSFSLAGFSAGAGFVLWRSHSAAIPSPTAIASSTVKNNASVPKIAPAQEIPDKKQATEKKNLPNQTVKEEEQKAATPKQETLTMTSPPADIQKSLSSLPEKAVSKTVPSEPGASAFPLAALEAPPPPPLSETRDASANFSAVQHSPFAAAPPVPREPTSPQREVKQVAKRPSIPSATGPKGLQQGSSPYKVLMPNGETRTLAAPTSSPLAAPTATTNNGTSLSFLQWSNEPDRRIAFLRVNGGPLTMAHEGDTVGDYTVVEIRQDAVELRSGETHMTLRP